MERKHEDYFTKKIFRRQFVPAIISACGLAFGDMMDGIVVGPVSYTHLDVYKRQVFTIAVICAGAAALICAAACLIFPETAAGFLGAEGEILPLAAAYIRGLGAGALPIIISQVLMAFTKTDGSPRLGLYSIIVMTVINITLDFCNVLFFHLGMFGMAMATSISLSLIHILQLTESIETSRALRHDLRHHLTAMTSFIEQNDMNGLAAYLAEYRQNLPFENELQVCGNHTEDVLVRYYLQQAKEAGAEVDVKLELPADTGIKRCV